MKIVFAPDAVADLKDIFTFIAADNPERAMGFVDELQRAARDAAEFPLAWPLIPRYERFGYRRRPYKGYLIFFQVSDDAVIVLRILNGARDYERLLFPNA
jgi:plasmid stabilization system protein ParE